MLKTIIIHSSIKSLFFTTQTFDKIRIIIAVMLKFKCVKNSPPIECIHELPVSYDHTCIAYSSYLTHDINNSPWPFMINCIWQIWLTIGQLVFLFCEILNISKVTLYLVMYSNQLHLDNNKRCLHYIST